MLNRSLGAFSRGTLNQSSASLPDTTPLDRARALLDKALAEHPDNFDLWLFAINSETSRARPFLRGVVCS